MMVVDPFAAFLKIAVIVGMIAGGGCRRFVYQSPHPVAMASSGRSFCS